MDNNTKVVGIQLRTGGKIYDFASGHFVLKKGDRVVVDTEQGEALGSVYMEPKVQADDYPDRVLKKVLRLATDKDLQKFDKKCEIEKEVYCFCYERIKERSLPKMRSDILSLLPFPWLYIYRLTQASYL